MATRLVGPKLCLEDEPDSRSIKLAGRYINVSLLASVMDANHGYLCRILAGKRTPSVEFLQRMASGLGMGVEELLSSIKERKERLKTDPFGAE